MNKDSVVVMLLRAGSAKRTILKHLQKTVPYGGSKEYKEEKTGQTTTKW